MTDKKNWGGPRKGAGRPPKFGEKMVEIRPLVPPEYKERIREIGDGNISRGVRRLLQHYEQMNPDEPPDEDPSDEPTN